MQLDVMTGGMPLRRIQDLARDLHRSGHDGLVITEAGRTAYLSCAAASLAADIDVLTGIAVAFPRSPMVTAATAWELAETSRGRFRLGLGTQVRCARGAPVRGGLRPPGPTDARPPARDPSVLRRVPGEAPLDHHGPFLDLTLLPRMWSPGPIDVPDPPIDLAAVNPWMLRLAGELADGVHVHPLNTRTYLETTVLPEPAPAPRPRDGIRTSWW